MRAALACLAALMALPVLADTWAPDPGQVACKLLMSMNDTQRITVAMATKEAMEADARVQSMSDADVLKLAIKACAALPDDTVLQAVKG